MQLDLMLGRTWADRSAGIPDTPEARATWDRIAAQLAEGQARGWVAEIPGEVEI